MTTPRRVTRARAAAACVLGAALLAIASCTFLDPFSGYRGVNLIADHELSATSAPAWGIVYADPTKNPSNYPYLSFGAVTAAQAGTTVGLPASNDGTYRLEIPNLIADGDFEAAADVAIAGSPPSLPTGWTEGSGASAATQIATGSVNGAIAGYDLNFAMNDPNATLNWIKFQLDTHVLDGFAVNNVYRLLFEFNITETSNPAFDYSTGTTSLLTTPWIAEHLSQGAGSYSGVFDFPNGVGLSSEITVSTTPAYFSIGSIDPVSSGVSNIEAGNLDNLRITRSDVEPYLHLAVPFRDFGRPDLVPGAYKFAVWVKLEDPSQVTPSTPNAYDATGVTLGINTARSAFTINNAAPVTTGSGWQNVTLSSTQWTQISMTTTVQVSAPSNPSATVIDLYIAPTNLYSKDVGRLLVSTPTLEFLPNG